MVDGAIALFPGGVDGAIALFPGGVDGAIALVPGRRMVPSPCWRGSLRAAVAAIAGQQV